jgi:N-methylhydantoinase A/oxoprolinase/acetone carboxylase beta subunit
MRIGIDVGGTNTDAVLMDGEAVLAAVKTSTTPDVTDGIVAALRHLAEQRQFEPADVSAVMIGTTQFTNALVEGRRLAPTAAVRLGLPATRALPPMVDWPERLAAVLGRHTYMCHGGHEFDGREISALRPDELRAAAEDIATKSIGTVAIASVFSPVQPEFEDEAAEIIREVLPDAHISVSHEVGRMGLLERENATIVNASLRPLAEEITDGFARAIHDAGITAPLYLSQNDGTLMDIAHARLYPVATFASGPTNSMRGAAFLSGLTDCAVVDVGGTTSDVGILQKGFPREASTEVDIGGVRTNFRMPDLISFGIGGGSLVSGSAQEPVVGPRSVGYELTERALVFGGETLTATDIAVAAGLADIGDSERVAGLDPRLVDAALARIAEDIAEAVDRMRTSATPLPVVAVGGGSILVPEDLAVAESVYRPEHFAVANAIGAAIAQVGGEVDRMFAVDGSSREEVLEQAKQEAIEQAILAGARPGTVEIFDVEEVPLAYLPGNATRIRVKAVGDLQLADLTHA